MTGHFIMQARRCEKLKPYFINPCGFANACLKRASLKPALNSTFFLS